ncbi:MAG: hypothetical protein ACE5PV_19145 [Candidatus Poribacteria bacterium]
MPQQTLPLLFKAKQRWDEDERVYDNPPPRDIIRWILASRGSNSSIKKRFIAQIVIDDLWQRGEFYTTPTDDHFFFENKEKTLLPIESKQLRAQIKERYDLNPTESEYKFLIAELRAEATLRGKKASVFQFAHYDAARNILYIYNNAHQVYRLDGERIELVNNGTDGVFFLHKPQCEPFYYLGTHNQNNLDELMINPVNFSKGDNVILNRDEQRILFRLWLYSLFFESLLPTKPIQVLIGPKGSGKTMAQKVIGKLLFGEQFQVTEMPSREDAFVTKITHKYFVAFDNVDGRTTWLNDQLARVATGEEITRRRLYTTNDEATYVPRCFLSLSTREPDFRRDDVVDRLLIFQLDRLKEWHNEFEMLQTVLKHRDVLWTELLNNLSNIVAGLSELPESLTSQYRMADFALLAQRIATAIGLNDVVKKLFLKMNQAQSEFLFDEEPIWYCLQQWLEMGNSGRSISSGELFTELKQIASINEMAFPYKSARSFGMRLKNILTNLREFVDVDVRKGRSNRQIYIFTKRENSERFSF